MSGESQTSSGMPKLASLLKTNVTKFFLKLSHKVLVPKLNQTPQILEEILKESLACWPQMPNGPFCIREGLASQLVTPKGIWIRQEGHK